MRLTLLLLFCSSFLFAQDTIMLANPSFEGFAKLSYTPKGWYNCGFPGESQVDLHPVSESEFKVDKTAFDGNTYLGMVVRENDTWEAVGQKLEKPLIGGKIYDFNVYLARSESYISALSSQNTRNINGSTKKMSFSTPCQLRIWGGNGYCGKTELLAETGLVENTDWENYQLLFRPQEDFRYITFEVFYQTPTTFPYNGNILLDGCSDITEISDIEGYLRDTIVQNDTLAVKTEKPLIKSPKPLSQTDKKFYTEQMSYLIFRRGMTTLEPESTVALKAIAKRITASENEDRLMINMMSDNSLMSGPRSSSIRDVLNEVGLDESRYSFGAKPTSRVLLKGGSRDVELFIY